MENEKLIEIFNAMDVIEQQRGVLGDETIDQILSAAKERALALVEEPSESDYTTIKSWETLIGAAQALELPIPEPTSDVAASIERVNAHTALTHRITMYGGGLLAAATKQEPAETTVASTPSNQDVEQLSIAVDPVADDEVSRDLAESLAPTAVVTISNDGHEATFVCGDKRTRTVKPVTTKVFLDLLQTLSELPEGESLRISDYMRIQTGGLTAMDIHLIHNGKKPIPMDIDYPQARATYERVQAAITRLRDTGIIKHTPGSASAQGDPVRSTSGTLELKAPIIITGEWTQQPEPNTNIPTNLEATLRSDTDSQALKLTLNHYERSIDTGTEKITSRLSGESFKGVAKTLGLLALRVTGTGPTKVVRSEIVNWSKHANDEAMRMTESQIISHIHNLRALSQEVQVFPLQFKGSRGGGYYLWDAGTEVQEVSGWPEKPNFENAIKFKFIGSEIHLETPEGEYVPFVDYRKQQALAESKGLDTSRIRLVDQLLIVSLSMLEANDFITTSEIYDFISSELGPDHGITMPYITDRLLRTRKMIEAITTDSPINTRSARNNLGSLFDINRRFTISGETYSQSSSDHSDQSEHLDNQLEEHQPQEAEKPQAKMTAAQIVDSIDSLDEVKKKTIRGLILDNTRFEYPRTLTEAAYLIDLVTDAEFTAELRENSLFAVRGIQEYKAFVSEILFTCYLRSMSWGSFEDLYNEVVRRSHADKSRSDEAIVLGRNLISTANKQKQAIIAQVQRSANDHETHSNNQYSNRLTKELTSGKAPKPHTPYQAIMLLDRIRETRSELVKTLSAIEHAALVSKAHEYAQELLGNSNARQAIDSRTGRTSNPRTRAVLVTTGGEVGLTSTDSRRFPERKNPRGSRNRIKRRKK